jgi:hypothetical protein
MCLVSPPSVSRCMSVGIFCAASFFAMNARAEDAMDRGVPTEGEASTRNVSSGSGTSDSTAPQSFKVAGPALVETVSGLWDPSGRAGIATSTDARGSIMPLGVGVRIPVATQEAAGFDLALSVRYRTFTSEGVGRAIDARISMARSFGPVLIAGNALLGQSLGGRDDVDFSAAALLAVNVVSFVRLGVEGRVRTEAVDATHTTEDDGRPVEWLGGATVGFRAGPAQFQSLVGWCSPRGWIAPAPFSLVSATLSF